MNTSELRITEIFYSLQGETSLVGLPTVFIRLTGCPLRCHYCDTAYAFSGGTLMSIDTILSKVREHETLYVTVTGGEPLAQPECYALLTALCDNGYRVSLETSGALDIALVDARVIKIVDLKTPASGEEQRNKYENIQYLLPQDQIKFVICDRVDYEWAKSKIIEFKLSEQVTEILFSPSYGQLAAKELAEWILQDHLSVRMQIQLHKYLWGNKPGH